MNVETITMPKEQAQLEWKNYRKVLVRRNEKYLKQMEDCLSQMKRGRKILDIFQVMKKFGVNEEKEPQLAIARADWNRVYFTKKSNGCGVFGSSENTWRAHKQNVILPDKTFPKFPKEANNYRYIKQVIETKVPIVPVQFLPKGGLRNYYILWEAKTWEEVPQDPLLLKRITNNLFSVLAVWDLTKLERAIIRGKG